MNSNTAYTFDDILLIPKYSENLTRKDADTSSELVKGFKLKYPIISANMDTITEFDMANTMISNGAFGILHRFYNDDDKYLEDIEKIYTTHSILSFSVGTSNSEKAFINKVMKKFNTGAIITIDIAHGHSLNMKRMIKYITSNYDMVKIIAGNVATFEGAIDLVEWGADAIKIGVGPGSLCTTRLVTGCGYPQFSAILDIDTKLSNLGLRDSVRLIADGGIKYSGDIVKALAAGADTVMIGSLFAGTIETPGEVYQDDKQIKYKVYRGMASKDAQISRGKKPVDKIVPEGVTHTIRYTNTSCKEVLDNLIGGLESGMSYQGAKTIKDLQNNLDYVIVTSTGLNENIPHGIYR